MVEATCTPVRPSSSARRLGCARGHVRSHAVALRELQSRALARRNGPARRTGASTMPVVSLLVRAWSNRGWQVQREPTVQVGSGVERKSWKAYGPGGRCSTLEHRLACAASAENRKPVPGASTVAMSASRRSRSGGALPMLLPSEAHYQRPGRQDAPRLARIHPVRPERPIRRYHQLRQLGPQRRVEASSISRLTVDRPGSWSGAGARQAASSTRVFFPLPLPSSASDGAGRAAMSWDVPAQACHPLGSGSRGQPVIAFEQLEPDLVVAGTRRDPGVVPAGTRAGCPSVIPEGAWFSTGTTTVGPRPACWGRGGGVA